MTVSDRQNLKKSGSAFQVCIQPLLIRLKAAKKCVKPFSPLRAETSSIRMPNSTAQFFRNNSRRRLDHGPNWLKHTEDGLLLWGMATPIGQSGSTCLIRATVQRSCAVTSLIGSEKSREGLITSNWPDILRIAATMTAGTIDRRSAKCLKCVNLHRVSSGRQNDLAAALREIGRHKVERTLFMIDAMPFLDADMSTPSGPDWVEQRGMPIMHSEKCACFALAVRVKSSRTGQPKASATYRDGRPEPTCLQQLSYTGIAVASGRSRQSTKTGCDYGSTPENRAFGAHVCRSDGRRPSYEPLRARPAGE